VAANGNANSNSPVRPTPPATPAIPTPQSRQVVAVVRTAKGYITAINEYHIHDAQSLQRVIGYVKNAINYGGAGRFSNQTYTVEVYESDLRTLATPTVRLQRAETPVTPGSTRMKTTIKEVRE
jgi:hypothetical protein